MTVKEFYDYCVEQKIDGYQFMSVRLLQRGF